MSGRGGWRGPSQAHHPRGDSNRGRWGKTRSKKDFVCEMTSYVCGSARMLPTNRNYETLSLTFSPISSKKKFRSDFLSSKFFFHVHILIFFGLSTIFFSQVVHLLTGNHNLTHPCCFAVWILGGVASLGDPFLRADTVKKQVGYVVFLPEAKLSGLG